MKFIAGIDPGTTTGIAIADISSDYYETFSARNFSVSDACDFLLAKGKPVAVASDVRPAPDGVRKIASAFNARLATPPRDLALQEKRRLIGARLFGTLHERDALSAALFAKQHFSELLRKVDYALERKGRSAARDEVKELLIKRKAGNIEQALMMIEPVSSIHQKQTQTQTQTQKQRKHIDQDRLLARISGLEQANKGLEQANREMRQELAVWKHRKESAVLSHLRQELARGRAEHAALQRRYELLERLSATHERIVRSESGEPCSNKVVLLSAQRDLPRIEAQHPRAIITDAFVDTDIPVISPAAVQFETIGPFLAAERRSLDALIARSFADWIKGYKDARKHMHEQ